MLNKQVNDPDVAGVGQFVEENFCNLGLGDHPVQALNRAARNDPAFRDVGRQEVTLRDSEPFKFRALTLHQLKVKDASMSIEALRIMHRAISGGGQQRLRQGRPERRADRLCRRCDAARAAAVQARSRRA